MSSAPAARPPVLAAQHVSRSYGPDSILNDVSLSIHERERVGLVGVNGSGKTTLARILAGAEAPDAGDVVLRRGARVVWLSQAPDFDETQSARDTVLSGLEGWLAARAAYDELAASLAEQTSSAALERLSDAEKEVERLGGWDRAHQADAVMQRLGVDADARLSTMSGGQRRRVALARALVSEPDLAILDEPTNHLDADTVEWLETYLRTTFRGALLLITHDRYLLDRVVERTLEVEHGQVYAYQGGWVRYLEQKAQRQAHAERAEANRQNLLRRELEWLRRGPKARGTKQKARIDRAEALQNQSGPRAERTATLALESIRSGKTILDLDNVGAQVGGKPLIRDLTLTMCEGDRIGVVGPSGSGKTTLLRIILGQQQPTCGTVKQGANTSIAYLDQARSGLDEDGSVRENVAEQRSHVRFGDRDVEIHAYLARFLFDRRRVAQKVGSLSGGEKARVLLAKLLLSKPNLLILDEPSNDLDVHTLSALEDMIVEFQGAVWVVSHDRYFLDRIATSILAFEGEGRVTHYAGDYSAYRNHQQKQSRPTDKSPADKNPADKNPVEKGSAEKNPAEKSLAKNDTAEKGRKGREKKPAKRSLTYGERIELKKLEQNIAEFEEAIAALEVELSSPTGDLERLQQLANEHRDKQASLAKMYARWEAIETKREELES